MLDHIIDEILAQGKAAPRWVRDCVEHHTFLQFAMEDHKLGMHEHKPYREIEYLRV